MERKKRPELPKESGKKMGVQSRLQDLVRVSSLIFTGTVLELGKSSVPAVPANESLVVVRLDRSLRVDPVLGDVRGKMVTLVPRSPGTLHVGQRAVFFTNSWIHGRGIAVREVEHMDVQEEDQVVAAVDQLPQVHLNDRLKSAELVVDAEVARISPVEQRSSERNVALWAGAELRVKRVLHGAATKTTRVYFPTADWPPWTNAPRFTERQRGIFILHTPGRDRTLSEATLDAGSLVALDLADFQPESELHSIEEMLATIAAEGGIR